MTLASHTGWALSELLELNGQELMAWLEVLPRALTPGTAKNQWRC